jgi:hypothetical protein
VKLAAIRGLRALAFFVEAFEASRIPNDGTGAGEAPAIATAAGRTATSRAITI